MFFSILLFVFYFLVAAAFIYLVCRKQCIRLSFLQAVTAYAAKVVAGCAYGYFFLKYYGGDDTWQLHEWGLAERKKLLADPLLFFKEIFLHGYSQNQSTLFFATENNYWKDLPNNLLAKMLGLINVFSGGNYYVNVLFFSVLSFAAIYLLFRFFQQFLPASPRLLYLLMFFFPAVLFWQSGIRKDGVVFFGITLFMYAVGKLYLAYGKKYFVALLISFLLVFLFRNAFALALLPATILLFTAKALKKKAVTVFFIGMPLATALFFCTSLLPWEHFNLPQMLANRQYAFQQLQGGSYLPMPQLEGRFQSYIAVFPYVLNHMFLRPYPTEIGNPLYALAFAEHFVLWSIIIFILIAKRRSLRRFMREPLWWYVMFLVINAHLLIGYTVPFLGAIVRYNAAFELQLFALLLPILFYDRHIKESA